MRKEPAAVNNWWRKESAEVNCRRIHRQLTTDVILIQIYAEAPSSIITQNLLKFLKSFSKSL